MELRVSQRLQGFTALLLSDDTWSLQVVEGEDVLELLIRVDDWAAAVIFSDFDLVNKELLNTFGLFVC